MTVLRCVCGDLTDPPAGTILKALYPTSTFCRGCGRRQLFCGCLGPSSTAGDGPAASRQAFGLRGRTEEPERLAA